ncbi:MAG: hypothetical protein IJA63_02920 [Akkermansia sp.]|nr:hypothetical protein [Akkermansia sp.]
MITTIVTMISPFVVADQQEQVATPVETTAAVASYDWNAQTMTSSEAEESPDCSAMGTFCLIPGGRGAQCVDDWHMA